MTTDVIRDGDTDWPIGSLAADAVHLTDEEREMVLSLAEGIVARHAIRPERWHLDSSELMLDCDITMRREAPRGLAVALASLRRMGNGDGALLVRNLPIGENLPPTPSSGDLEDDWLSVAIATAVQLMVMNALGDVISYADEKHGRIIQDVVPVRGAEELQENCGSCLLELHTEDGFHPSRPRYLSLLGLRGDRHGQAWTVSSGIDRALRALDGGTRATLARPIYRIRLASSFVGGRDDLWSDLQPVLQGSAADPNLCVDFHAVGTEVLEGRRALIALRRALLHGMKGHVLQAGDLLVLDNDKAVHGRTAFSPAHDGNDRWLRRCFAVADLRTTADRRLPSSRVHQRIVPERSDQPPALTLTKSMSVHQIEQGILA